MAALPPKGFTIRRLTLLQQKTAQGLLYIILCTYNPHHADATQLHFAPEPIV